MVPWSWFTPLAGSCLLQAATAWPFLVGLDLPLHPELAELLMPRRGQAGTSVGSAFPPPAGEGSCVEGGPVLTPDFLWGGWCLGRLFSECSTPEGHALGP